ncbi:MAG TPA: hypothetical protein VFX60_19150 [Micromonospora sp.]|nr:hypothetical protein [Micromonospora sp.]
MSAIPHIQSMRPEPRRDQYGRYVLPDPATGQERSWTRATTIAHTLDDTHHLAQWQRRMVLQGVAAAPELLAGVPELAAELAAAGDDWRAAKAVKQQLDAVCDDAAKTAGAGDGALWGTLLHTITEYADAGRLHEIADQIPDGLTDDLTAYRFTMDTAGIGRPPEYIERILVNTRVDSAGTTDRILTMPAPCPACGGTLKIGDLKTQKSIFDYLSICIQLAEYAYADNLIDPATGDLAPMPDGLCRCTGIVMHLPVGKATCTLHELDLVAGWKAAQAAHTVRQIRARGKGMGRPWTAPTPAVPDGDRVLRLIASANHPDALTALWRDLQPRGQWTDAHTAAAAARKAQLTANT